MPSTLDAVEAVLRDQAEGKATNRARRRVALPKSGLNYMAAGAPGIGALGLKVYSVARTGARFYTMLFDPESGELLSSCSRTSSARCAPAPRAASPRGTSRARTRPLWVSTGRAGRAESQLEAIAAVRDLDARHRPQPQRGVAQAIRRR